MIDDNKPSFEQPRMRGIYLLPNLFTTVGLFAGFYAIVAAMKGMFDIASIAIYVAMVADSLDGRVARLTGTQSKFGAEYDSLSDMVGFGIAPALVAYSLALHHLGKIGWLAAFCYTVATALRLARFNIQATGEEEADKRYFQGLPSPAAAGLLAGLVWVDHIFLLRGSTANAVIAIMVVLTALLMVSNINYLSFKDLDLKNSVPFFAILIVVLVVVAIAMDPPHVLFSAFLVYALSGPIMSIKAFFKGKKNKHEKHPR
ncbi:MAG: CDP-diacylglycerol--serine O-phosphatidyltransferase [Legionellaceae bacterium]|nr:CDP-diacylglycerol--serine O-phosphatidyltransferase [Legionellaceae bacterium]